MTFFGKYPSILFAVLILSGLPGCKDKPSSPINAQLTLPSRLVNGFRVPVFPTAAEQLNYTNSWFESLEEKKAGLAAVPLFFPEAIKQKGKAALNLSYLNLGRDYRLATPSNCRRAIKGYSRIIAKFTSQPDICAKAYWYKGWIYSNLLHNKKKGIEMFRMVITGYPHATLNLTPSVPWVTFITPSATGQENKPLSKKYWADLARLEIVQYPDTAATARQAFFELWHGQRNQQIIGISLKLMLESDDFKHEIVPLAKTFLAKASDTPLKKDIRRALDAVMQQQDEKAR